jgi:3D (Asp-Asp-Asp) domain-containing protein
VRDKNVYALWCVLFTLLVIGLVAVWPMKTLEQQIDKLKDEVAELHTDLAYCEAELERDDTIFMSIFGDRWSRSKPMYRVNVTVTAYSSRVEETDDSPHVTASGVYVRRGIVALSQDLRDLGIETGDAVFLYGYGILYVEDSMHPRKHRQVDVWIADTTAAQLHGVSKSTLMWFGKGDG